MGHGVFGHFDITLDTIDIDVLSTEIARKLRRGAIDHRGTIMRYSGGGGSGCDWGLLGERRSRRKDCDTRGRGCGAMISSIGCGGECGPDGGVTPGFSDIGS